MTKRRVVITGLGTVAPNGIGKEAFWKGLKEGKNCVDKITFFDASEHASQVAAEIKEFEPTKYMSVKDLRAVHRVVPLTIAAADEALKDAGIYGKEEYKEELGVIMGTGAGGLGYCEQQIKLLYTEGMKKVSPHTPTGTFVGMVSSEISIRYGFHGESLVVSTGCTAASDSVGYAFDRIRFGRTDMLVTGGSEACITPAIVAAFARLGALSTGWNDKPKRASRPFNKDRDGFVMGEGAWVFIIEELEHAKKRGAKIYAEVLGYGATCDAYHKTAPGPTGTDLMRAFDISIKDAGVSKEDIDYINLHGTSTQLNDRCETLAIKKYFGERAKSIPTSSFKSMLGHPQGASGACGLAGTILAIQNSFIPPTINQENPDPECDLDYVPNVGRKANIDVALVNSIAFGSKNASLIISKYKE